MVAIAFLLLVALVVAGVHVAAVLGILALLLEQMFSFFPLLAAIGEVTWSASTEFILVAVPMFILMGQILLRTGVAGAMFVALDKWVNWLPGGLMHTNVASSALFAATSGSSVATAATIGTIAIPNIEKGGYNPPLFLGSLAAGGTLGILIPPSINMIIYGVLSDTSVTDLYLAAMVPGILLAAMFSLSILLICLVMPTLSGNRTGSVSWYEKLVQLKHLVPPLGLFIVVVGSIYLGIATPTEAASLGVVAALGLGAWRKALSIQVLMIAFQETMKTTAMVMLIVVAAFFLNFVLASIGVNKVITDLMVDLPWSPTVSMLMIVAIYLVLGMFMETLSLMIATTPIIVPAIVALGFDKVWFGVVFMILIEAALITPPIGVNLFVVQSVRGGGPFRDVIVGALPFLLMMIGLIFVLLAFPGLALWLPRFAGAN
jgi:tripartite ATP-independent transporter DctM subunit